MIPRVAERARGALLALALGSLPALADPVAQAEHYWLACASCHGEAGQGSRAKHAPRIAGQQAGYLERQLQNFRDGLRGMHPQDQAGRQMHLMAAPLADAAVRAALARQIAAMPGRPALRTLSGDAQVGAALYTACSSCHGARGEGNAALGAPRLAGIDDWYLLRQMRNYRSGLRGSHAEDHPGRQMAEQARLLATDEDLLDLMAYIGTMDAQP